MDEDKLDPIEEWVKIWKDYAKKEIAPIPDEYLVTVSLDDITRCKKGILDPETKVVSAVRNYDQCDFCGRYYKERLIKEMVRSYGADPFHDDRLVCPMCVKSFIIQIS